MNLLNYLKILFQKSSELKVNETPLQFSELALKEIQSHNLEKNSAFRIEVDYKKNSYTCSVGFDNPKYIKETLFEYPVLLIISKKDELFLRGCSLEYEVEKKQFFIYPDIQLEVDFKKPFLRIYLNRFIISPNSKVDFLALEKKNYTKKNIELLNQILKVKKIKTVFIKKNFISLELENSEDFKELEEEIVDALLNYFTKCSYPILVTDTNIEEEKFETTV